jgi:TalC/MipB family fructose-6-phosphate aldolase
MALYIDCAFLNDIMEVSKTVPVSGVTTNPSLQLAAWERGQKLESRNLLVELLRCQDGLVFIQPGDTGEAGMYEQALAYIQTDPNRIVPKIPLTQKGMKVALRLKANGYRIAFTAVTSVPQVYAGAMAKADFVIPYYNRMERAGIDAYKRVHQMATLLQQQQLPTRILTASIKTSVEAANALLAGSHDLTVPPQVLMEMITDELTEQALDKFSQDWQRMKKV